MAKNIIRSRRKQEVRDCLASAQVPPRRFFALYLAVCTGVDLVSVGVQLMGGDKPLLEDLPSLFVVILANLVTLLLGVGTQLYALGVWRGQRVELAGLFDGFSFAGRCLLVAILQYALVGAGLTLMVVPGVFFFYTYRFALLELCQDPTISPVEAMRRSRFHSYGYKGQLLGLDVSFLPWLILAQLPAIYLDLPTVLSLYSTLYGVDFALSLPVPTLSPLVETLLCDAFYFLVALLFLPRYATCQASYFDTACETNPLPPLPQPPQE